MAVGIYTAPERVTRDGALVCFEGEKMTMDEAVKRGLVPAEAEEPEAEEPVLDRMGELMEMSAKELEAYAAEIGAEHAKGANKATVAQAILEKESK